MRYKVTIEETVSDTFEIIADDPATAKNIAMDKYNSGDIVLAPGSLSAKKMLIADEQSEVCTDWEGF